MVSFSTVLALQIVSCSIVLLCNVTDAGGTRAVLICIRQEIPAMAVRVLNVLFRVIVVVVRGGSFVMLLCSSISILE